MGTTRLKLYQDALQLSGERALSSLSEEREPRRKLDLVWNNGGVRHCLEQAQWHFSMRTQKISADPDYDTSDFGGYTNTFPKPTDWVATSAVCSDPYFRAPLVAYADEVGVWMADIDPIYVKFVSDDEDFGGNLGGWPATFADYVAAYFASKTCIDEKRLGALIKPRDGILATTLAIAKNKAAMTQPTRFTPPGSWINARHGGRGGRNDRGNPGSLIG